MTVDERIKILGTGCAKCDKLETNTLEALKELNINNISVGHVRDVMDIAKYGVMMTPALVIDEKAVSAGKVLSVNDIKKIIEKKF